jgi:hypothetical protein
MDKDQTVIDIDGNPVPASTKGPNRTRRRWWRYNGALAPPRAKTTGETPPRP